MRNKELEALRSEIKNLAVKKKFKIKLNGDKVKIVRNDEESYTIYHDGFFIHTLENWEDAFRFAEALLESD